MQLWTFIPRRNSPRSFRATLPVQHSHRFTPACIYWEMEFRQLGRSGLKVPVLSFGTGTFGGGSDFFRAWGATDVAEASRLVSICLEAGVNLFDTADVYSKGLSEEILGKAVEGRRHDVLISTKTTFRMGEGPNDLGSSRHHLLQACEASLRRLGTDYIDIYHLHGFDALTPVDEVLSTLNHLIESGKVRYIACSNFSGWHLMKSLAVSERYGWARYVGHQVYYSLIGREYEWELMPLGAGSGGRSAGLEPAGLGPPDWQDSARPAFARHQPAPSDRGTGPAGGRRLSVQSRGCPGSGGRRNWKKRGAGRAELAAAAADSLYRHHRRAERGAVAAESGARKDGRCPRHRSPRWISASEVKPTYPYWHQMQFAERNPFPVSLGSPKSK